jgi:hypothetical protein
MAKDTLYDNAYSEFFNGIDIDVEPAKQKKGSRRYTLNTVERSGDKQINLANEPSNIECTVLPQGYIPIGRRYISNGETVIISTNPIGGRTNIGILKDSKYKEYVDVGGLGTSIAYQCDIRFRIRRGNTRVIYWTDGLNNARSVNLDRLYEFYNADYEQYLKNPVGDFLGDKWDISSFELIKRYSKIPSFDNLEQLDYGSILPGSYNFTIQLVDEDLNPTNWITTSNITNIYNDSFDTPFERIRGSRNVQTSTQSWMRASKSIKLTIGHLDTDFPYYRVGVIRASSGTGQPDKVLVSDLISTYTSTYTYSGDDANLTEVPIGDVLVDKEVIYQPKHLEQQENILLLLNGKGKQVNWCSFQESASKISSKIIYKDVILNTLASEPNVKNVKARFTSIGNMPGEVYSYAAVYVFDDGYISPAFHIPGINKSEIINPTTGLCSNGMLYHELDTPYLDIHNCTTNSYWGEDYLGNTLVGSKVRHHRFPFRKDVGKPLVTHNSSSVTINKYRASATFNLNPAYKSSPSVPTDPDGYPINADGTLVPIGYTFDYKITGSASATSVSNTLIKSDLGLVLSVYDDLNSLDDIGDIIGAKLGLDSECQLAKYQDPLNPMFIITQTYIPYALETINNVDTAQIFGIEFSNIESPHPNVIGFYIVRNKREDDDRIVIDNGVFGPMTKTKDYKSLGVLAPKQFYHCDNCGHSDNAPSTPVQFCDDSMYLFSPEYEFFQRKIDFDDVVIEGVYSETSYTMPTVSDIDNSICNEQGSKGIYVQNVQAGTSFDPSIDKGSDDDGFDLLVGYRSTNMAYASNISNLQFPDKDKALYLSAASYFNYNDDTYYNVSVDNKMGVVVTKAPFSTELLRNTSANQTKLLYGSMVRTNTTSYANFMNRSYYKEHNNMVPFPASTGVEGAPPPIVDGVDIFNGDAQISAASINSTMYYDTLTATRKKKNGLLKIIIGAVLIAAGVALIWTGAGAAIGAVGIALTSAALSYGVSLAVSGIKFDQYMNMIQSEYEKGLKTAVVEGGMYECIRDNIEREDDTIRWFGDLIPNIYFESAVPLGLRSGLTCGVTDFMDSPMQYDENGYRAYLTEKLTYIDKDQGSGRLYRGFASAEVYDMNVDYMRMNEQKVFNHLPVEYDCCDKDGGEIFPRRIWWSEKAFQEELTDNYRAFLPNNYVDVEGEHGEITGAYRLGNNLFIQTTEATWQLPQNQQERVTNEVVSFVGTGSLFSILPRKILDTELGSAGTIHKWANCKTAVGMFAVSELEQTIYLHSDKITRVSDNGIHSFCLEFMIPQLKGQLQGILDSAGIDASFTNDNNPANPYGTGYHSVYDPIFNRVLFTKRDYLILSDTLDSMEILSSIPNGYNGFAYNTTDCNFYHDMLPIPLSNRDYFEDRSFTLSYSLNTNQWVSWHSYIPTMYFPSKDRMYSYISSFDSIWIHLKEGSYHTFYGTYYPHLIEGVINTENVLDKTFEDMSIQTRALAYSTLNKQFLDKKFITFNKLLLYNDTQCSGEYTLQPKETEADRQNWYAHQVNRNPGILRINRRETVWNINGFRDNVIDYESTLFTLEWDTIKQDYPIDKVPTPNTTSFKKDWMELENFRGKYIIFRLKLDNFDNINLITNYLITTTLYAE